MTIFAAASHQERWLRQACEALCLGRAVDLRQESRLPLRARPVSGRAAGYPVCAEQPLFVGEVCVAARRVVPLHFAAADGRVLHLATTVGARQSASGQGEYCLVFASRI